MSTGTPTWEGDFQNSIFREVIKEIKSSACVELPQFDND